MTLPQHVIDAVDRFGDRCAEGLQTGPMLVERRKLLGVIERHVIGLPCERCRPKGCAPDDRRAPDG